MSIAALREKRARAIEQAKAVLEAVETEGRTMNEEETRSWDGWMSEADALKATLERMERTEAESRALEQSQGRFTSGTFNSGFNSANDSLRSWLLNENGAKTLTTNLRGDALRSLADRNAWEGRALSTGTNSAGGYTVPQDFANALEVAMLAHDGMRGVASVLRTSGGNPLPWPTTDDTDNEGSLIGENVAAGEQDVVFGSKTFGAYKITSGIVRVPHELIQDAGVNVPQVVGELLGTRIGRALNRFHTVGTGVNQFEGAVTGATLGTTGTTLGNVSYDELVALQHSVDPAYRSNAVFMFNDQTFAKLKQVKLTDGSPLWLAGMAPGAPDTILGHRYIINQHMADLGTSGARSILFGDASKFKIRDVSEIVIVRADERYFEYGQTAFVGWYRGDSKVLDAGTGPLKYFKNAAA